MEIKYTNISELNKLDGNPRMIKKESMDSLVKSIKDNPDYFEARPLILSNRTGKLVIIAGNQRLEAAKKLKLKQVPTFLIENLTEEREKEIIIRDNVANGEWDFDALQEWDKDLLEEWGVPIPSDWGTVIESKEDDYEIPDEIETDIALGDMFQIGQHRLLCGDSTQTDTWKRICSEEMFDCVVTDPPYNVDYVGKTKDALKIQNDKKTDSKFYQFLYDFYTALGSFTKPGGAWYVWHADSEGANFRLAMANSGIMVKQCLIWVKQTMVMGRQDYQWKHEPCLYGWKEGAAHGWYSDRKQTTVLNFDRPSRSAEHPTMKPVELIGYQITNSSKSGDLIGDGFLGSGTTMVASHQLGRKCYGMEIDPKYCQVIIDRMKKLDPSLEVNPIKN